MISKVKATEHEWSEESLFSKALLYVQQMEAHTADTWLFGFWSTLGLELLARAALAHISPILVADNKSWQNLRYALGQNPTAKKFSPSSLNTKEVLNRLHELLPAFNDDFNFCLEHIERRNSEIHSGKLAFASLGTSKWLPKFYSACNMLLESMDKKLEELVSNPEKAQEMIDSLKDDAAKAVRKNIEAYKQVWLNKNNKERIKGSRQARNWATLHAGHRVVCPSCDSNALVKGTPSGPVTTNLDGDNIIQRQTQWPSSFECIACGLRISGLSKLSACGLGDAITAKSTYTSAEFFDLYTEDDLEQARQSTLFEDDFNE